MALENLFDGLDARKLEDSVRATTGIDWDVVFWRYRGRVDQNNPGRINFNCGQCGEAFFRFRSQCKDLARELSAQGKPRETAGTLFCSIWCRSAFRQARKELDFSRFEPFGGRRHERLSGVVFPCGQCGADAYRKIDEAEALLRRWTNPIKPLVSHGKTFCNAICQEQFFDTNRLKVLCATCGDPVERPPCLVKNSKTGRFYCSEECTEAYGREEIKCSWPECSNTFLARRHQHKRFGLVWKTEFRHKGRAAKFPICDYHREIVNRTLGETARITWKPPKWFIDPSRDIGSRGVNPPSTKMLIWAKTGGKCARCDVPLDFHEKPRKWACDHTIPWFEKGPTNYFNLLPLCGPCHDKKSAEEKSRVTKLRHRENRKDRWLVHTKKDEIIDGLRAEVKRLRLELAKMKAVNSRGKRAQRSAEEHQPLLWTETG